MKPCRKRGRHHRCEGSNRSNYLLTFLRPSRVAKQVLIALRRDADVRSPRLALSPICSEPWARRHLEEQDQPAAQTDARQTMTGAKMFISGIQEGIRSALAKLRAGNDVASLPDYHLPCRYPHEWKALRHGLRSSDPEAAGQRWHSMAYPSSHHIRISILVGPSVALKADYGTSGTQRSFELEAKIPIPNDQFSEPKRAGDSILSRGLWEALPNAAGHLR